MNGTADGPEPVTNGKCVLGWVFGNALTCPNCDMRLSCVDCQLSPDCIACANGVCMDRGLNLSAFQCSPVLDKTCSCHSHMHCSDCTRDSACAWCPDLQRCFQRNVPGALPPSCGTPQLTCPPCESYGQSCQQCSREPHCRWCGSQCLPETSPQCTTYPPMQNCDEQCRTLTSCEPCTFTPGCSWCSAKQRCEGADLIYLDSCTKYTVPGQCPRLSGFDGASFVGGMATVVCLALVAGFVYFIVRFYHRRRTYTEV